MDKIRFHGGRLKNTIRLDFSVNTNPLGPPFKIYNLIKENLELIKYYPEEESLSLKYLYGQKWNINFDNLIFGNGAAELIFLYLNAIKPKRIVIPMPSFSEYYIAAYSITDDIVLPLYKLKENEFILSLNDVYDNIIENTLVIIGNPNNPTGSLFKIDDLLRLLEYLKKKESYLLVDEAFMDFVIKEKNTSLVPWIKKFDNLFIVKSFTKVFSIPGIRLGVGIGPPKTIKNLENKRDPWSVNIFAQVIAKNLINMDKFILKTQKYIIQEQKFLYRLFRDNFNRRNLQIFKTETNFYLVKFPLSSNTILDFLLKKGIYARDASNFYGLSDGFIRFAIKTREENLELFNELKILLNNLHSF